MLVPKTELQPNERSKILQIGSIKVCLIFSTSFWHSFLFVRMQVACYLYSSLLQTGQFHNQLLQPLFLKALVPFNKCFGWKKQLFCS